MIVKPKPYSKNILGGYLLNDIDYNRKLFSASAGYVKPSKIKNDFIYSIINGMMSTPFKVNRRLLDYLIENNHVHKLLMISIEDHSLSNIERNKYQEKEYQKFLSEKLLEDYIIKIAKIYSNIPEIYFPVYLDSRGRLYPQTSFFHYQGSELAKALLLFSRPDTITRYDKESIEYLKSYGAVSFGNGLNRKSYADRLKWVEAN